MEVSSVSYAVSETTSHKFLEASQGEVESGRIDHDFIFEQINPEQTSYRILISVAGDMISACYPYLYIPDSFYTQYSHMRSYNIILSDISLVMECIYIGISFACIVILVQQHWILWRAPLKFGIVLSLLSTAQIVNEYSKSWITYSTAISPMTHRLEFVLEVVSSFIFNAIIYSLLMLVTESIFRKAFPHRVQICHTWNIWNSSNTVWNLYRAYCLVAIFISYEIAFSKLTTRYLNWYTPTSTNSDPNTISHVLPFLSSVVNSLKAGILEECFFRVIPLSTAVWLGKSVKWKKTPIVIVFVIQMVVFSTAHAIYPSYPSYRRIIELLLPSFVFGLLFLYFGLIPSVTMHFVYG